jgi:YHS domain-containing protein
MTEMKLESYAVWDRPTRWFHWINFACVVALAAIGTAILYDKELGVTEAGKILLKTTHVWFGYKTDCSVSETYKGKTYCFGNEQAKTDFMKDPDASIAKAEAYYSEHSG